MQHEFYEAAFTLKVVAVFLSNGFQTKSLHFINSRDLHFLTLTLIH